MDDMIGLIAFISVCVFVSAAKDQPCTFHFPYVISETAPNGTVILNVSKPTGNNATFHVVDSAQPPDAKLVQDLQNRLLLINYNTSFTLENTDYLDLEKFMARYGGDITTVKVKITCGGQESDVLIKVDPVNEFNPVFKNSQYNLTVPESTKVGTVVFKGKPRVIDMDLGEVQNFIFKINPYNIRDFDGSGFFNIPASSQGNISLSKALDYDDPNTRNTFRLNVSVADGQSSDSKTSWTEIDITIQDVDDQVPYFDFPNCPKPCPAPPFEATVKLDSTGQLSILPKPLKGKDDDTLGIQLLYSIQSGNQYNLFEISQTTGIVTQKTSVNTLNLPDSEFRLVIQVRKNLTNVDLSSIAILTVHVWERMSNDSGYPEPPIGQSKEDTSDGSSLLIPLIVLGVALAIVLVALIVVFVIYRRKQREMSVRPVDDKSEPQTEEEELHTEGEEYNSNEKLVFGNKTTLGIMTDEFPHTSGEKANRLPPLPMRDTATETTEGKKKKKSRRRNKNKEPEIFDGTREYNMGLDPEFFDSTDKSKVKRSQRSRKADSALPIQVPNDNPADQDSVYM